MYDEVKSLFIQENVGCISIYMTNILDFVGDILWLFKEKSAYFDSLGCYNNVSLVL